MEQLTSNGRLFLEAAGLSIDDVDVLMHNGEFDDLASPRVGIVSQIPRSQRMREFGIEALQNLQRNSTGSFSSQGQPIPNEAFIAKQVRVYGDDYERRTISTEPYWRNGPVRAINRAGDDLAQMLAHGKYRIAPPLGRPPLPASEARTARIEWRTTEQRKARAAAIAHAQGLSLSAWLDGLVDRARK